jgi:pimeloyl-ACP methyl ester carboxylesterase
MPDPVLLVPGTQATSLRDDRGTRVYNAVSAGLPLIGRSLGGRPREGWSDLVGMSHRPGEIEPELTSLEPETRLIADSVVLSPYNLFPKYYEEWPYDWRGDLRWNGARLLDELRARRREGGPRVTLIGHSQGGLLVIVASKLADAGEFATLVSRVILVGAPLAGTMRAVESLVFGSTALGAKLRPVARKMARTWPAIYQMLPSWASVSDAKGEPLPPDRQLLEPGGWPEADSEGITADMLARARAAQALFRDPFDNFGPGIAVTTILSQNQRTGTSLIRAGDGFTTIPMQPRAGDNLVPYAKTLEWGGNPFAYTVVPFAGRTRPHAELCIDPTVAAFIISRVNAPAPDEPT